MHVHGLEDMILLKWNYSPNQHIDQCNHYQNLNDFFEQKEILKFIWNCRRVQILKLILEKNNKVETLTLHNPKTYYDLQSSKKVRCTQ